VILCGGEGKRLSPLSTPERPKQVLPLFGGESLLMQAARKAAAVSSPLHCITMTAASCEVSVRAELGKVSADFESHLLVEPYARNTAAAVIMAALYAARRWKNPVLWILTADHVIHNVDALARQVKEAAKITKAGAIVSFGIAPARPEPDFGYMVRAAQPVKNSQWYKVEKFVEKPTTNEARTLMDGGRAYWNSGMCVATAETLIAEAKEYNSSVLMACKMAAPTGRGGFDKVLYQLIPSLPFDKAVLEPSKRVFMAEAAFDWADIGTWERLKTAVGNDAAIEKLMPVGL
jgi:mannose-1-phosphate guanylyltransferase